MTTIDRSEIEQAVKAASKLRILEAEVARLTAPYRADLNILHEIASKAGIRTGYLKELAHVGAGLRQRHRSADLDLKKTG